MCWETAQRRRIMFNKPIRNLAELRAEKQKLRWEVAVREANFEEQLNHIQGIVETPMRWIHYIKDLFSHDDSGKSDLTSSLAQISLPLLLNSVIFKRSSLVVKGIVGLISQQLAKGLSSKKVSVWLKALLAWLQNNEESLAKKKG